MDLICADVGGTHARFAIAAIAPDGRISVADPVTVETRDHASFESAWERFADQSVGAMPRAAAIAVAGPVGGDAIACTNSPWVISPAAITARFGIERLTVINDFGAIAHAVACLDDDAFIHLAGPDAPLPAMGTITVVGPGTGLGVAHLWRDGAGDYRVQPTEGGHIDFAPLDALEDAILVRLRQRHRRVSAERVVAGPAIVDIYETLAAIEGRAIVPVDDRTVWQRGIGGTDDLAVAAVERFCCSLGSVAGDLALAHGASGVVIAGGLGLRLRDILPRSGFADRFCAKGRYEAMMAGLPVKLVTHPQPGLLGAAAAFAQEHAT